MLKTLPDLGAATRGSPRLRALGPLSIALLDNAAEAQHGRWLESGLFLAYIQGQGDGGAVVEQDGRSARLETGDLALVTRDRPFALRLRGAAQVLLLPGKLLRARHAAADALTATLLPSRQPLVRLLSVMLDSHCAMPVGSLPPQAAALAAQALVDMLAACLATPGGGPSQRSRLARFHVQRIREFALSQLHDPELSVATMAKSLSISTAHIHRVFAAEEQTLSTWLWETRLKLCHDALRDNGHAGLSISQIAFRYGFSNAAHFSRTYRSNFGLTARETRRLSRDAG